MIPDLDDRGYLPPGIHRATLEEVAERFGRQSEIRRIQMESLGWLVEVARRAGVQRLIINGSFVTDKLEPDDVDCLILTRPGFSQSSATEEELFGGLPFMHIQLVKQKTFDLFVREIFALDVDGNAKGLVEVLL
jgi:hypothetical protein